MNELSLFTGAGGGVLGTQHLLGWRAIGYVEFDAYCQAVIKARIQDGLLHDAPIFGDIRDFISSGCAEAYSGMVDIITAGFPCQPFSVAGKKRGADDERNMWPATIECIRVVRPRFALLENVPNLIASGYFGTVIGDLYESGYDARWRILSAAEVGAPHQRDRVWIVANAHGAGFNQQGLSVLTRQQIETDAYPCGTSANVANASSISERKSANKNHSFSISRPAREMSFGRGSELSDPSLNGRKPRRTSHTAESEGRGEFDRGHIEADMADTDEFHDDDERCGTGKICGGQPQSTDLQGCLAHAESERLERNVRQRDRECSCELLPWACSRTHEDARLAGSRIRRVSHGVAHRVDRLKALGNGQVSLVAATAWLLLTSDE